MTMSFKQQLDRIVLKTKKKEKALFQAIDAHVGRSILVGSSVTGAPGQPVKTGALLASWKRKSSIKARRSEYISRLYYAGIIEDNARGATLRSEVGGFHSVRFTRLGWQAIVKHELAKIVAQKDAVFVGGAWRDPRTGRFVKAPG